MDNRQAIGYMLIMAEGIFKSVYNRFKRIGFSEY
jgi:hypothetical protein